MILSLPSLLLIFLVDVDTCRARVTGGAYVDQPGTFYLS